MFKILEKLFKKEKEDNVIVAFKFQPSRGELDVGECSEYLEDLLLKIKGGIYPIKNRWDRDILDTDFIIGNKPFISLEYFYYALGIFRDDEVIENTICYGWDDLTEMKIKEFRYGYLLEMPKLKKLLPDELSQEVIEKMNGI